MATLRAIPRGLDETLTPLEHARRIAGLAQEKLAEDVLILDMRPVCSYTDYVVLATGHVLTAQSVSLLGATSAPSSGLPSTRLHQNLEWVERETIRRALEQASGVKKDAAELMGISQRALSYYLAKYRID